MNGMCNNELGVREASRTLTGWLGCHEVQKQGLPTPSLKAELHLVIDTASQITGMDRCERGGGRVGVVT